MKELHLKYTQISVYALVLYYIVFIIVITILSLKSDKEEL
jgi:hypothetical protein